MIPPDDTIIGKFFVLDLVNVLPRVLGKGDVSASLLCILAGDACLDLNLPGPVSSNQNSANFGFDRGPGMLSNLAHHLAVNHNSGLCIPRLRFLTHGVPCRGVSAPRTAGASP